MYHFEFSILSVKSNNFKSYIELYYPTDSHELYYDNKYFTVGDYIPKDKIKEFLTDLVNECEFVHNIDLTTLKFELSRKSKPFTATT